MRGKPSQLPRTPATGYCYPSPPAGLRAYNTPASHFLETIDKLSKKDKFSMLWTEEHNKNGKEKHINHEAFSYFFYHIFSGSPFGRNRSIFLFYAADSP
jgi:hypothetical protein